MIYLGINKMPSEKTCNNCMRQFYCGGGGTKCFDYQSLGMKLKMINITTDEWKEFSKEWDETRTKVRKKLGYEGDKNV